MIAKKWFLTSIGGFMCYYETHKSKFVKYCEIVITRDGDICLPIMCGHGEMLRDLCKEIDPKLAYNKRAGEYEILTATRAITVSYLDQIMVEDFYSEKQKFAYDVLLSNNLIVDNLHIIKPHFLHEEE